MEWGGNNNSDEDFFFMNNGLKMIGISVPWCTDSVAHPPPPSCPSPVHCLHTGSGSRTGAFYKFSFKLPQGTNAGLII